MDEYEILNSICKIATDKLDTEQEIITCQQSMDGLKKEIDTLLSRNRVRNLQLGVLMAQLPSPIIRDNCTGCQFIKHKNHIGYCSMPLSFKFGQLWAEDYNGCTIDFFKKPELKKPAGGE